MLVDHEKNALGAGYIVEFIHDDTKNYYEGVIYACRKCQVEPLGRLGESLVDLAVKNRNFRAHENCCHFYVESAI